MSVRVGAGLGLALGSAAALNWGFFVQHGAAASLPPLSLRRPLASLRALFASLRWLSGFGIGIGGWALYVAALALAPLSLVQAVSAGGIGLLALLVRRVGGVHLGARERRGVAVSILGLALLAASLPGHAPHGAPGSREAVTAWLVASVLAAALAGGPAGRLLAGGAGLGLAAGILYAAGDVATKAAVPGGARLAFVPVVLACHGLAFVALQLAFQRGSALATAGVATLLTNALPIAAGTTVFHEGLGPVAPLRALSFVCVVIGAALLAGSARDRPARARSRGRLARPGRATYHA
jgi:hypothetical protein